MAAFDELLISPEDLRAAATEFETCGTTVQNITNSMTEIVNGLAPVFSGEEATAYTNKFKSLQDDIQKLHAMIKEYASDLNEAAVVFGNTKTDVSGEIESLPSDVVS